MEGSRVLREGKRGKANTKRVEILLVLVTQLQAQEGM